MNNGYVVQEAVWINQDLNRLFMLKDLLMIYYANRSFSVNDIVLNWNTGTSFLDALFIAMKIKTSIVREKAAYFLRQEWVAKPTNERLDFLFNEFSNLLN